MNEILIGQSYYLRFDPKLWEAMQPYPPLGSMYAAAYVRSLGYSVSMFDSMLATSEAEWDLALAVEKPRYAVLYEDNFNYLSKMCLLRMRQAAFTMIEMASKRGCTVIVSGSDASDHAGEYLSHGASFVLIGEGEHTLGELLDHLSGRAPTDLASIQGLAFWGKPRERSQENDRGPEGFPGPGLDWRQTTRRPDIRDLDNLPFPAWDLVDTSLYRQIWQKRHGYISMNMVTTRGCPYHCNWCAKPIWGQRYNARSPENVVAEMKWIKQSYRPDHIWFADDIIGLKPGWLERFAQLVQDEQAGIPFKCLSRVDLLLREGEIEHLRRAGCQTVWVGAESGSQKVLDAMEKGTRIEQIYETTRHLKAAGIRVGFFLQFGYPGEKWPDILQTLKIARECQPDEIGMSVSYPLPGTRFHQAVQEQLGEKQNWVDSNDLEMLYQGPFSTEFYRKLHTVLHREFRARKAWHALSARVKGEPLVKNGTSRKRTSLGKEIATLVINLVNLCYAWPQLILLALRRSPDIQPLSKRLPSEAAARPSPQGER